MAKRKRTFNWPAASLALLVAIGFAPAPGFGQTARPKPYDEKLLRLSEILGAIHYLRELCGSDEGQLWRDQVKELIQVEGTTSLRRVNIINHFNRGYRNYQRTYRHCTPSARTALKRFFAEGVKIAETLSKPKSDESG